MTSRRKTIALLREFNHQQKNIEFQSIKDLVNSCANYLYNCSTIIAPSNWYFMFPNSIITLSITSWYHFVEFVFPFCHQTSTLSSCVSNPLQCDLINSLANVAFTYNLYTFIIVQSLLALQLMHFKYIKSNTHNIVK